MTSLPYTTDTSAEAEQIQLELLRKMTPGQRARKALALSAEVARQCKAAIRRRYPEFDENEASLKFIELNYGKDLSEKVRIWRADRERPTNQKAYVANAAETVGVIDLWKHLVHEVQKNQ